MLRLLVLFFIFGLTTSSPIDTLNPEELLLGDDVSVRNTVIEGQLRNLLEDLRQTMLEGTDTIPVLDPLNLQVVEVDETRVNIPDIPVTVDLPDPVPGLSVMINDLIIKNLATFEVKVLSVQMLSLTRLQITFDIDVPVVEVDVGHYDVKFLVDNFSIFGKGDGKLSLVRPGISGVILARTSIGFSYLYVTLEDVVMKVALEALESQLTGLLGGDANMDAFVNTFLGFLVPEAIRVYEEEITRVVSDLVLIHGNEILADLNLRDLLR